MILGVGSDLIDISRIERTLERFGDRFLDRIFTAAERARSEKRAGRAASYAKRYAAKEACLPKALLGTGFPIAACSGATWASSILPGGRPTLHGTDRWRARPARKSRAPRASA